MQQYRELVRKINKNRWKRAEIGVLIFMLTHTLVKNNAGPKVPHHHLHNFLHSALKMKEERPYEPLFPIKFTSVVFCSIVKFPDEALVTFFRDLGLTRKIE